MFKFGGTTNVLGVSAGGVAPSRQGDPGVLPSENFQITVQNRAILCKIWQYLCRKLTVKVVLVNDILLADKGDSQPNKTVQR